MQIDIETIKDEVVQDQLNGNKNHSPKKDSCFSLGSTPMIPDWIYDNLPEPFKTGASLFNDKREKDTFLLSSIVFLSGCLPNYSFHYFGKKYYTNLYAMLIAPAGSGKGKMMWAKKLGKDIVSQIKKENDSASAIYESDVNMYYNTPKKQRNSSPPEEPIPKRLLIPANTSSAYLLKVLNINGGHGIMFETEADMLSSMQGNSWSDYSVQLRSGFEHEPMMSGRVGDVKFSGVEFPMLTVLLSGTPNQVAPLIHSVENGLFSRFLYYYFNPPPIWKDPFIDKGDLGEKFNPLSHNCFVLWKNIRERDTDLIFSLKEDTNQTIKFNDFFRNNLKEYTSLIGGELSASIFRLGVIAMRIAAILSIFRNFGNLSGKSIITPTEKDLDIALELINVSVKHTVHVHSLMLKNTNKSGSQANKFRFFQSLPGEFSTHESVVIGDRLGLAQRTTEKYLTEMVNSELFVKKDRGIYKKYNS